MPIVWSDRFVVGIERVDAQHRQLIESLNALEAAVLDGASANTIAEILDFLQAYATEHFAHEELVMAETRCPSAGINCLAHQKFARAFTDIRAEFEASGASAALAARIQANLMSWIEHHIGGVDCRLRGLKWPLATKENAA